MVVHPYWINHALAIIPRPAGGDSLEDEMRALREAGINVLVSMLEDSEAAQLGLALEETAAQSAGLRFVHFPIRDRGVPPNLPQFEEFLSNVERGMAGGERVGVHCRGCIGRSSVVAASLLIRSGVPIDEMWRQIEAARGSPVPDTLEQFEWVDRYMRAKP